MLSGNLVDELMADPDFLADVTGLPRDLIWGIAFILQALNSGLPIDPELFMAHCAEVRVMFYALASWVEMWPSLHKVNHGLLNRWTYLFVLP